MSQSQSNDAVRARNLKVSLGGKPILRGIDLTIRAGEFMALIGVNGSGKTVFTNTLLGLYLREDKAELAGDLQVGGKSLLGLDDAELRKLRAASLGVIFQDYLGSLNPLLSVADQMREIRRLVATGRSDMIRDEEIAELLRGARLNPKHRFDRAHEMSAGMVQRALVGLAVVNSPALLITDEITSSLDVLNQEMILQLLRAQQARNPDLAILFVTHNMRLVQRFADRVCVMYGGRIVEVSETEALFDSPKHPATRQILRPGDAEDELVLGAVPPEGCVYFDMCDPALRQESVCMAAHPPLTDVNERQRSSCALVNELPEFLGAQFDGSPKHAAAEENPDAEVLLKVRGLNKYFSRPFQGMRHVIKDVSFDIKRGVHVGLIGASGSGKTTIGNLITGIYDLARNEIDSMVLGGEDLSGIAKPGHPLRRRVQMIFQDTGVDTGSLDPRKPVEETILESWRMGQGQPGGQRHEEGENRKWIWEHLAAFGLETKERFFPDQLSGGQRQRVEILRSLNAVDPTRPSIVVADEPTSFLDPFFQSRTLDCMKEFEDELDVTYIIISHDLTLIRAYCQRVIVLLDGEIIEEAAMETVFDAAAPRHPYTELLLASSTGGVEGTMWEDRIVSFEVLGDAVGCPLQISCPYATEHCKAVRPKLKDASAASGDTGHRIACHART